MFSNTVSAFGGRPAVDDIPLVTRSSARSPAGKVVPLAKGKGGRFLEAMPLDVFGILIQFLSPTDVARLRVTCRALCNVVSIFFPNLSVLAHRARLQALAPREDIDCIVPGCGYDLMNASMPPFEFDVCPRHLRLSDNVFRRAHVVMVYAWLARGLDFLRENKPASRSFERPVPELARAGILMRHMRMRLPPGAIAAAYCAESDLVGGDVLDEDDSSDSDCEDALKSRNEASQEFFVADAVLSGILTPDEARVIPTLAGRVDRFTRGFAHAVARLGRQSRMYDDYGDDDDEDDEWLDVPESDDD